MTKHEGVGMMDNQMLDHMIQRELGEEAHSIVQKLRVASEVEQVDILTSVGEVDLLRAVLRQFKVSERVMELVMGHMIRIACQSSKSHTARLTKGGG